MTACMSSLHTSLYGVPQGSVLGPLRFIMYTTPLSTLISSVSLYHHLCWWHTTFSVLSSLRLSGKHISHLQNAVTQITSWMTSNLLSLKSSKTEFLLIGLKRQLSKIHNSSTSIDTTQSARNLGFVLDEHLSFSDQISALSITFVLSAVSVPTLIFTPKKQLPPPLYNPCLTTVTHCIVVFRNFK